MYFISWETTSIWYPASTITAESNPATAPAPPPVPESAEPADGAGPSAVGWLEIPAELVVGSTHAVTPSTAMGRAHRYG